jgi:hypothetical protein
MQNFNGSADLLMQRPRDLWIIQVAAILKLLEGSFGLGKLNLQFLEE